MGSITNANSCSAITVRSFAFFATTSSPTINALGNSRAKPREIIASLAKSASVTRSSSRDLVIISTDDRFWKRGMISDFAARRTKLMTCICCDFVSDCAGTGNVVVTDGLFLLFGQSRHPNKARVSILLAGAQDFCRCGIKGAHRKSKVCQKVCENTAKHDAQGI